ncbi:hypothetical protein OHS33_15555 [Streptomyces sp. NBC_00536]|uniref:hypothetical protein n=1 Tax=Streptomyces sp. NBC_00536 TaxID=2975769 RepID=UPI002E80001E|nr:hypothetical protein [Streptomyces sp. NBC_00536]WUC79620.1 hypothetical protein OHS33_15555 [Streptomyces sp. NBC_00536]
MSSLEIADFYPLTTSVSPSQVSGFLSSRHWTLVDVREGAFERWAPPGFDPEHYPRVLYLLPLNREYADFDRRFAELMSVLAEHYACDSPGLQRLISSRSWDCLTVRLVHADPDSDTIGLAEAKDTLGAIYRLLDVSARYTHDPHTSFGGRRSHTVMSYMRERVTLGHTQHGSFIFPVYSLLDGRGDSPKAFARAVMENLATGLSLLGGDPLDIEQDHNTGGAQRLAAMLANALLPLSKFPGLKSVDLSLQWASGHPGPRLDMDTSTLFTPETIRTAHGTATQVAFGRSSRSTQLDTPPRASTSAISTSPVPRSMPYESRPLEEFSGPVLAVTLDNRASVSGGASGYLVIGREEQGEPAEVRVAITEEEYYRAVAAHRERRPVAVTGAVFQRGRTWWVDGQISFGAGRPALPSVQSSPTSDRHDG